MGKPTVTPPGHVHWHRGPPRKRDVQVGWGIGLAVAGERAPIVVEYRDGGFRVTDYMDESAERRVRDIKRWAWLDDPKTVAAWKPAPEVP